VARSLFGVETEYAVTALNRWGSDVDRETFIERLLERARAKLVHLIDAQAIGMFLENGSRFYVDHGHHPELATPECSDPREVVRYILAGERIVAELAREAGSNWSEIEKVLVFKGNVDYSGSLATWGCHESYLYRCPPADLRDQIVPHLVSRLIYTGAGGFDSGAPGVEFTLSPRVAHLAGAFSDDSTQSRGIFHSKDEALSGEGYHRLHVICGESLCSERAMWLKTGTTALVVAMIDAGLRPGDGAHLQDPILAMRTFAADPACTERVALANGRTASALMIQHHYLKQVEAHLRAAFMPSWAEELCEEWRRTLDGLREDPKTLSKTLDWTIKYALYTDRARRHGFTWDRLREWSELSAEAARTDSAGVSGSPARRLLKERGFTRENVHALGKLRQELFEIDTLFGELGGSGIFSSLERAGVLEHSVPGLGPIDAARTQPPESGRAKRRGELVRRFAGQGSRYRCDWGYIWDLVDERVADLREPFEERETWRGWSEVRGGTPLPETFWPFRDRYCG